MAINEATNDLPPETIKQLKTRKRRQDLDGKRKESGLQTVRVYLDKKTVKALDKLVAMHGYASEGKGANRRAGVMSNIIGYCVRSEAGLGKLDGNFTEKLTAEGVAVLQQIYQLRQVIKYRREEHGERDNQVIKFLKDHQYPTPTQISRYPASLGIFWKLGEYPANNWKQADLDTLDDRSQIKALLRPFKM